MLKEGTGGLQYFEEVVKVVVVAGAMILTVMME